MKRAFRRRPPEAAAEAARVRYVCALAAPAAGSEAAARESAPRQRRLPAAGQQEGGTRAPWSAFCGQRRRRLGGRGGGGAAQRVAKGRGSRRSEERGEGECRQLHFWTKKQKNKMKDFPLHPSGSDQRSLDQPLSVARSRQQHSAATPSICCSCRTGATHRPHLAPADFNVRFKSDDPALLTPPGTAPATRPRGTRRPPGAARHCPRPQRQPRPRPRTCLHRAQCQRARRHWRP